MSTSVSKTHSQYATWSPRHEQGWRGRARHIALDLLSAGNQTNWRGPEKPPHVQFLYIHHVFCDEENTLRQLLSSLSKDYTFLSHSDGVRLVKEGQMETPTLCFSSDDGFLNNLTAAHIFSEFGISACFFLNPDTIGMTNPNSIQQFCRSRLNARPVDFLNWDQVETLQKMGHEVGSHSLSHLNLAELTAQQVQDDLGQSKSILEQHCGPVNHFAYPYGRWSDFNQAAMKACMAVGHTSCATAERGCHANTHPLDLSQNLLFRDQVILGWPERHIRYFMKRNLRRQPISMNQLAP